MTATENERVAKALASDPLHRVLEARKDWAIAVSGLEKAKASQLGPRTDGITVPAAASRLVAAEHAYYNALRAFWSAVVD